MRWLKELENLNTSRAYIKKNILLTVPRVFAMVLATGQTTHVWGLFYF